MPDSGPRRRDSVLRLIRKKSTVWKSVFPGRCFFIRLVLLGASNKLFRIFPKAQREAHTAAPSAPGISRQKALFFPGVRSVQPQWRMRLAPHRLPPVQHSAVSCRASRADGAYRRVVHGAAVFGGFLFILSWNSSCFMAAKTLILPLSVDNSSDDPRFFLYTEIVGGTRLDSPPPSFISSNTVCRSEEGRYFPSGLRCRLTGCFPGPPLSDNRKLPHPGSCPHR